MLKDLLMRFTSVDNGDIYEENNTDFLFGDNTLFDPKKLSTKKVYGYAYNQRNPISHKSCCTLYSSITAISNLMNYKFSDDEIESIVQYAETRGYKRYHGWSTYLGVDTARKRWNAHMDEKIASFSIDVISKEADDVQKKGYMVVTSIKGDREYSKDRADNGWIDGRWFGKKRGHAIAQYMKQVGNKREVRKIDSYKGYRKKYNDYGIKNMKGLLDSHNMYSRCYVFIPESEFEVKLTDDVKRINQLIAVNSKMWHKTKDKEFKKVLHNNNTSLRKLLKKLG